MSEVTDALLKEIENLDPGTYYKEPVCLWPVSKELRGEFSIRDQHVHKCNEPGCQTLKGLYALRLGIASHRPCDSVLALAFDGGLEGELMTAQIDHGHGRGYHVARLKWGGGSSTLVGRMIGITNAGTHRDPLMQCEPCDARGHMEGRMDAVVVDGDHKGCRLVASYMIAFDPGVAAQSTFVAGTLEGVLICDCRDA
jgi:hypothetical protein